MSVAISRVEVLGWRIDDRRGVQTKVETAKPKGVIKSYTWPSSAYVGEWKPWTLVVHNEGAKGVGGGGIGNRGDSPGAIKVRIWGKEITVEPGYALFLRDDNWEHCEELKFSGEVSFTASGTYYIVLMAAHKE